MPRPQFTLRALLVAMLAAACFFGGIHFERERQRRAEKKAMAKQIQPPGTGAWTVSIVRQPDGTLVARFSTADTAAPKQK